MQYVYEIIFQNRKERKEYPCYYIGSKTNSTFSEGKILDDSGKPYTGSSKSSLFKELMSNYEPYVINILDEFPDEIPYNELLNRERERQIECDALISPKYFNMTYAGGGRFSDPNYGTYRHVRYNKFVRLPKDHPSVLDGTYVNSNTGMKTYNNGLEEKQFLSHPGDGWVMGRLEENIQYGEKNPFFGKTHNKSVIDDLSRKSRAWAKNNKEFYEELGRKNAARITGTRVSEQTRQRMKESAPKNRMVLKSISTGDVIRIPKDQRKNYDSDEWITPYAYKMRFNPPPKIPCPHCNKMVMDVPMSYRWHFDNCKHRESNQ